jgi:hypothetical protein
MAGVTGAALDLGARAHADLRWVVSVLWGDEGIEARLGDPRPGETVLADLLVVPDATRPRVLVPRERRAARAAVAAGASTRGRASRLGRAAAGLALRTPASRFAFRDRLVVVATGSTPVTIGDALAEALGTPVLVTVNVRPPTPARKPVLQVLDRSGEVLAYAKVGWHPVSDANVRAEAAILRAVEAAGIEVAAPVPIAELERGGHPILVTAPMPDAIRRFRLDEGPPPATATRSIASLAGLREEPLAGGEVARVLRGRLEAVRGALGGAVGSTAEALDGLLAGLDGSSEAVPVGTWHGDWSPWNLGRHGGRVWAWDWEYARAGVPLGLDVVHYGFQVAFIAERRPLADAVGRARGLAGDLLAELGLGPAARDAVGAAHLAEVTLRYLESLAEGVAPPERFTAEAVDVIRAGTARIT